MERNSIIILLVSLMAALGLVGCSQADPPRQLEEVAVVEPTATATALPTATVLPPPTATPSPTLGPPTATSTRVVTRAPTPTPQIYVVNQDDTLFGIALEFGLTTEALAAANGMDEDDFLQLGQELVLPTQAESAVSLVTEANSPAVAQAEAEAVATKANPTVSEPVSAASDPAGSQEFGTGSAAAAAPAEAAASEAAVPAPPPAPPAPAYSGPPLPDVSHPANINPLTGLPVADPARLQRRPLIVRIGNDVGARQSQVGLNRADLVYEEIAEWWVTRFSAIYLAETPNTVGPVRSARLINVQLGPQYQAALAHSGGSDPVRWEISQAPIANLDEYYNPAPYFYRPNQGWQTRLAIDAEAARTYLTSKGLEASVTQQGFLFSDTPEGGEPGENIFIPYPSATSFTEWHYDAASGKYLRWINGAPLIDAGDGQQVSTANVIIYFAEHQQTDIVEDANGATSIRPIINGTGPAWFFREGTLTKGAWQTDGTRTPYFTRTDGSPYPLKPGSTWVEVVPTYFTIGLNSADEASAR